jgi:hypothetical protein
MNDDKDFFDEMIDVDDEAETETVQYFEDDEAGDEEDDEPSEIRTAVLAKRDMLALLTLKTTASGGQIVRFDPRDPVPSARRYESDEEAARWFGRSLATSRKNGWQVVYDGEPLVG